METRTKMTIFFQKSTGNIKSVTDWKTSIEDYFVEEADKQDYSLIWDYVVIDYNESIFNNYDLFRIDTETQQIIVKEDVLNINTTINKN